MSTPENEHEVKETFVESEFYPDHAAPRTGSPTFEATKKHGHEAGARCAVSLTQERIEYHHIFVEWAYADAVDWQVMKDLGTGKRTTLPVLDVQTMQPTGEEADARWSFAWFVVWFAKWRGFDWEAFDPTKPETFVDSPYNMLPLAERFHRAVNHGIHARTFPTWTAQALPMKAGFIFSEDNLPGAAK